MSMPLHTAVVVDAQEDPAHEALVIRRLTLLAALDRRISVLTIGASRSFEDRLRDTRFSGQALSCSAATDWRSVRDLAVACGPGRTELVYCMGPRAHARGALAAKLLEAPAVVHPLCAVSFDDLSIARLSAATLFVTTDACRRQAELMLCPVVRVDSPPAVAAGAARRCAARVTLAWIGRRRDANDPGLFTIATTMLARERNDVRFLMIDLGAHPPVRRTLRPRIETMSALEWSPELLQDVSVYVHTGRDDASPTPLQDALAAGIPVVAPTNGFADFVARGEGVYYYAPGSASDLARAMAAAIDELRDTPFRREVHLPSALCAQNLHAALARVTRVPLRRFV